MSSLLQAAEELEAQAAGERVEYLQGLGVLVSPVLDVGCGNGYSVLELSKSGFATVGVDRSIYRLSRWLSEGRKRQLVVADAAFLPFSNGVFNTVISSGMLEHVGVREQSQPYRVVALDTKRQARAAVVAELARVGHGVMVLDFPNGLFPVDFWHGDSLGAFRVHGLPDALNPSVSEVRSYARDSRVTLLPLRNRLRFHQISRKRWGRALAPVVRLAMKVLDKLPRGTPLLAVLYPFLVLKIEPVAPDQRS